MIGITEGAYLIAPSSLHWEIGNAFSAMFKRRKITLEQAITALRAYEQIPIRFSDVELDTALELSARLNVYAYDAYFIACAMEHRSPLVSLDDALLGAAQRSGVAIREVR